MILWSYYMALWIKIGNFFLRKLITKNKNNIVILKEVTVSYTNIIHWSCNIRFMSSGVLRMGMSVTSIRLTSKLIPNIMSDTPFVISTVVSFDEGVYWSYFAWWCSMTITFNWNIPCCANYRYCFCEMQNTLL